MFCYCKNSAELQLEIIFIFVWLYFIENFGYFFPKAVDHIRAISRSIVARDYESNCGDQIPNVGSFALIAGSPKKAKDISNKVLLECKQVVSEEDLDEVLTDH